jgi:hypothetical protein
VPAVGTFELFDRALRALPSAESRLFRAAQGLQIGGPDKSLVSHTIHERSMDLAAGKCGSPDDPYFGEGGLRSSGRRLRPGAQGLQMRRRVKIDVNDRDKERSTRFGRGDFVRMILTNSRRAGDYGGRVGQGFRKGSRPSQSQPGAHATGLHAYATPGHTAAPPCGSNCFFPTRNRAGMAGRSPSVAGPAARWGGRTALDLPVCRRVERGRGITTGARDGAVLEGGPRTTRTLCGRASILA